MNSSHPSMTLYPFTLSDVYLGMGMDETLFRELVEKGGGFFRMHGFRDPCTTVGYFQPPPSKLSPSENWTRRITGGGTVRHHGDVILSLGIPLPREKRPPGNVLYEYIHRFFKKALDDCFPEIKMASAPFPSPTSTRGYRCFQNPVTFDLFHGSEKILGGAIRRRGRAVLYQGAVRLRELVENPPLQKQFFDRLASSTSSHFGCSVRFSGYSRETLFRARSLSKLRYRSLEWKRKN